MPIRKVQPGQPMRIPASAYNAFVDAAHAHKEQSSQSGAGALPLGRGARVKNTTASAVQRGGVLAITGSLIDPANNESDFLARPAFTGAAPTGPDDLFVVTTEPIGAGKIGGCIADGLAFARVTSSDADHGFAVPKASTTAYLESDAATGAEIVWDEGGTVEEWALVRIGGQMVRTAMIEIGTATATGVNDANGNPVQWTYAAEEVEKSSAGYGGWATRTGGWSGTAYNGAEDENASGARQKSTGVDHGGADYPATFQMQAIQPGVKVLATLVTVGGTTEAWFSMANGEDGTCS